MNVAMISISSKKPSTAGFSHNGGHTMMLMEMLPSRFGANGNYRIVDEPFAIHAYDAIVINEGLNYKKGSFNFFGGMQEHALTMIDALVNYQGLVYCFNEEICWESLLKRKELRNAGYTIDDFPEVITINTDYGPKRIIGDSHSLSLHRAGYGISRNDGATLFGALKDDGLLRTYDFSGVGDVELYFGNIDVRFHLWRQPSPARAADQLVMQYLRFARGLVDKGINVTIQGLLPIEDESRKIPGTGKYKGENFYGTREERQALVDRINGLLERQSGIHGVFYRSWKFKLPKDGFEAPKFPAMEARQSVHLRPDYYYFYQKETKEDNQTLF